MAPHAVKLLPMRQFLDAVFSEMDLAQRRVFVESYIIKDDALGTKYGIIDSNWSTVGSFNINATAVSAAIESNLIVYQGGFVASVAAEFEAELAHCRPVDAAILARLRTATRLLDGLARAVLVAWEALIWTSASSTRHDNGSVHG
jgi:phosphatidylserine/phosphatidylglycerophosphate/cardiolipin synthase-like enzyme